MVQSIGSQAQLAMDEQGSPTTTFDGSSEPYRFLSENLQKKSAIIDDIGISGSRSHVKERTRSGLDDVSGQIVMNVSPAVLDNMLPRILGAAEGASDVFDVAETLPEFAVLIDRVAETYQYEGCKVAKATFRGSSGNNLIEMVLDIVGKSETTGNSFPSLTLGIAAADAPYAFADGVLTLQSGTREFNSFELVVDNVLETDFRNSKTATDIDATDRLVTLRAEVPQIADNSALYDQALAGATGTLVWTNGSLVTTVTFGTLQVPSRSPVVGGKGKIPYNLEMVARKTGPPDLANEISIKNVSA